MRKSSFTLNNLRNFHETFRKNVIYEIPKSHKIAGRHLLSRKCIFEKEEINDRRLTELLNTPMYTPIIP